MVRSTKTEVDSHERCLYFHYDEFCDLLGGAVWDQVLERWFVAGLSSDRHQVLLSIADRFSSSRQFLFSGDRTGFYPLEVLWLKWNLFMVLCHKIKTFHKELQGPYLNVQPAHVWIVIPDLPGDFLPMRWQFSIKIADFESASPFLNPGIPTELARRLYNARENPSLVYTAPVMRGRPLGYEETATMLIRSMERIREPVKGAVRGILETHLISENIRPVEYSEMDIFLVTFRLPDEQASAIRVWATKSASLERGLLLKGVTDPIDPSLWERLEKARQSVFSHSIVSIYKTYHVPCDLYSLGMMLLRTLLVNNEQDMASVHETARRVVDRLEPMVQGLDQDDYKTLSARLRIRLREEGGLFSKDSVLYRHEEKGAGCEIIPDHLWYDALILAFQLVAWIPGFSFCKSHGDYELENPHLPMEKVAGAAERLGDRIKMELFGSRQRNREMLEACDLVREDLTKVKGG
ncbi:MAG: hypothetical protein HY203_00040 [Nitrospirae bacterium]|nr:hypothetical protein [Nitrospirota bacterium]